MMTRPPTRGLILIAEDDPDDREFIRAALDEIGLPNPIAFVDDGIDLLDYLHHGGRWRDPVSSPRPSLLLLDLNMPRMDGRRALAEIRADAVFRRLPVVVLSTSCDEYDIDRCYDIGANSYVCKPAGFEALIVAARTVGEYWFGTARLPQVPP